jgi:hypothetical protein
MRQTDSPLLAQRRWLRTPALHFTALGAALFGIDTLVFPPEPVAQRSAVRPSIVITAGQIEELRADFARQTGAPPAPAEEAALIDEAIDNELLYQEALARGLDRGDRSIRYRLIEKMHFLKQDTDLDPDLNDDALYREALEIGLDRDDAVIRRILTKKMRLLAGRWAAAGDASEEEVQQYFEAHRDRYRQPKRVSLSHVFLRRDRPRNAANVDAGRLLGEIQSAALGADGAIDRGDAFALGHHFRSKSQRDLEKTFGPDFAAAVIAASPGGWIGPVPSPYGEHLVWITDVEPEGVADFASVRKQVEQSLRTERREAGFRQALEQLRLRYEVHVERATSGSRAGT